ncbi:MAG: PAS domain-containing protein [Lacunisphaera sp.]|nr:PAS domain-containing protein [Lacunisphaera sp.]
MKKTTSPKRAARLAEAVETLRAIRAGEVDALVGTGRRGDRVFTLEGAEHAYRVLIESMNEGALTLSGDKVILYANQCFARLVKCPLKEVIGGSFRRFLSAKDQGTLRPLMKRAARTGTQLQMQLKAADDSIIPVQLSIRELAQGDTEHVIIGMVVTDMTEARRSEELLRALAQRVVQVQEAERGRVALELHDHITQQLCAVLFSSQALVDKLSAGEGPAKREAVKLRTMLGQTAEEVERISRSLRPSALEHLGLAEVLRDTGTEFAARTGLAVQLDCGQFAERLPADAELAFYRILQEALSNVERHARARHVTVRLRQLGAYVELAINDDGIGFNAVQHAARRNGKEVLGLLGMHERAAYVGGVVTVKSGRRAGTEVVMRLPFTPDPVTVGPAAA